MTFRVLVDKVGQAKKLEEQCPMKEDTKSEKQGIMEVKKSLSGRRRRG